MYKHKTSGKEINSVKHPGKDWEVMKEEALDEARLPKPPSSVKAVLALGADERKSMAAAHRTESQRHRDVYERHYDKGSHGTPTAQAALDRSIHHEEMADRYLNPKSHFKNLDNRRKETEPGVHTMDEKVKMTKQQFANLDGNPKFTANDLHHVRKGTHLKKAAAGTIKEAVMNKIMKKLEEKKMTDAEMAKREEIAKSMEKKNPGMPMDKKMRIATATAMKVAEENKGFNNRHGLSVTASVEEQTVADLNEAGSPNPDVVKRQQAAARIANRPKTPNAAAANASRLANLRRSTQPLDKRDTALDNPTTQSNMALAKNPNIGGAGGGNYSAAQTRIPMAQKRAAAGDFLPAKPNTDRQNNDLNAMRVASRDTNQDRPASAKYKSEPKMRPDVDQAALAKMKQNNAKVAATNKAGPSFEKTGRGNAPSVSSAKTNVQTNLKPANVMSAKPSFEFSDKQREAAKKGKAGIKDVQAWAQSRGIKADPSSKEILRNYLNAAQNKTMKTDVKAGGTAATPTQTAAQSAELKMKAGMAQRSGPSVPAKPTSSAIPNVQPARNSTLAAPSAMANRPNVQPVRNSTLAAPSAMAAAAPVRKPATFGPK
jgi:hypothetical protein